LHRARGVENVVKGSLAPLNTNFRALKKCPIHKRFRNRTANAAAARARRRDGAGELDRRLRATSAARRKARRRTRFVKAEAVFFFLL